MDWVRKAGIVVVGGVAVIAAAASGGTSTAVKNSPSGSSNVNAVSSNSGSSDNTSSSEATPTTAASVAHTGDTISLKGQDGKTIDVTLVKIIDPAQGHDEFTTPDAGKRFLGAEYQVKNTGSGTFDDDANNDASVQGSDNQSYTADLNDIAGCTNFNSGQITLGPGESVTGCVVFQLPTGVTVQKSQFAANMGLGADTAEWLNP